MSEKRFYRASVCGDDGLYDKEDGCIIVNVKSNIDLDDNWNTVVEKLNELADENEQLKKDDLLFFQQVFDILMKYQHLFNREMADEVLEDLGIELTEWFE